MKQGDQIASLRAFVFRSPIVTPVVTSFGTMHSRPMVLVRIEDHDGAVGWGEVWCNFPPFGAEHRARIVDQLLAPLAEGHLADPVKIFTLLSNRTAVLALQTGELGPIAQSIAGVDIALWDLTARRAGVPLWRMLGGTNPTIRVYASGINPKEPEVIAVSQKIAGFTAFKLKIGFGRERDINNIRELRRVLGEDASLMVDANQAWNAEQATKSIQDLEEFGLGWIEEPLRADRDWAEWKSLARAVQVPLAAGENIVGQNSFTAAIESSALAVVQPDIAKWGGFSGCLPVTRQILKHGLIYCPHWLGGGIGLLASGHLLAAIGGEGMLEIDANANPLRSLTCGSLSQIVGGRATLTDGPGLGVQPDLVSLRDYAVNH